MAVKFNAQQVAKHRELADSIKAGLTVNTGVITEATPHATYDSNLPEGLTPDLVDNLSKYNARYLSAAHIAVAETSGDQFVANPSLNQVNATIGYFGANDTINIVVDREKQYKNQFAENPADREITKSMVMRTRVDTISTDGVGMKPLRDAISGEFADRFAK